MKIRADQQKDKEAFKERYFVDNSQRDALTNDFVHAYKNVCCLKMGFPGFLIFQV